MDMAFLKKINYFAYNASVIESPISIHISKFKIWKLFHSSDITQDYACSRCVIFLASLYCFSNTLKCSCMIL
ncbi:hypothetical protein VIGAN_02049300 [Vigna angularis var. angularis]|uniref:Uncharacterized protein n=1 Tax=Vigna angularis var. angularis TaxID=157739 RepID=A0A0S3RBN2_PHAAN|nr:hypothetical protein VIGAN_02049300 [Vigna angularis var. angularis]